ncbi:MAG: MlaC/ttg2D family ABC transporter substrate-binding protein [Burkholderiaceae bacterium]
MIRNNRAVSKLTGSRPWMMLAAAVVLLAGLLFSAGQLRAEVIAPDQLIDQVSTEVLTKIKADPKIQAGDFSRISTLVDETIMPHVNFERMTALAVGRGWRAATPEQRAALVKEFRILLLRTYSGAMSQLKDETVKMRPLRAKPGDDEVIVRSNIVGRGEPIQLNYRMEKLPDGWKIFDINVLGVWLIETYRNQFKQIVNRDGVDGLLNTLVKKNQQFAQASGS